MVKRRQRVRASPSHRNGYGAGVGAALITALGTVVIAIIGVLSSRAQSKDTRSRLVQDIEVFSKLEAGSDARGVMENHILESTKRLAKQERSRVDSFLFRRLFSWAVVYIIIGAGLYILANPRPLGHYHIFLEMLAWYLIGIGGVGLVLAVTLMRPQRNVKRRK